MKIRVTSAGTANNLPPEFEMEWPFEVSPQVGMSVRFTDRTATNAAEPLTSSNTT